MKKMGQPRGVIGRFFGLTMDLYNKFEHVQTIDALSLRSTDTVLEIGYGTGQAIQMATERLAEGKIIGIDHSQTMYDVATKKNKTAIQQNRAELLVGDANQLNFPDHFFDKVYSIHSIYFWSEPQRVLREIYRVLKSNGRAAIAVRTRKGEVYKKFTDENIKAWLEESKPAIKPVIHLLLIIISFKENMIYSDKI